ncbi:BTB/POZ domain-containing protein 3, partial [Stegodyphus mimosarum]
MERNDLPGDKTFNAADDLKTSLSRLLQKTLLTDVEFRVVVGTSAKVFPAHKLILACRSPILADRFYKEKDTSVIFEYDVGPLGIEQMIRYIYLDNIDSYSAFALKQGLEASLKYSIKSLENLCISYLMNLEVTGDNVYEVLDAANRVKHNGILQRCLEILKSDTETVLNSFALRHASLNTLVLIFQLRELNIESEVRLLEAAIMWYQHNRSSSSRDKLLSCIDIMALDVDEFLALIEKFPTFFTDSEIVSILSNIRHFGSRDLPAFCVTHNTKRKFLKPKCKTNVISNLGVSNSSTQTSVFKMLDKSTEISPSETHFFPDQKTASVQTSFHETLEKSTEISEEEVYMFRSTKSMTTGTQTTVVSTLDGTSQISKSEAFLFNRKQTVDREIQTTCTGPPNRSIQTSDPILRRNQNTKISKNNSDIFMSSKTYDTEVQRTFAAGNQESSPFLDVDPYYFFKNENENTHTSWPSLSEKGHADAEWKAFRNARDERNRINFEDEPRDVLPFSKQNSRKINDMVSTSRKEVTSDKTSSDFDPVNRIRIDLIGEPRNKEELKIKFTVYDGTEIQELITYYTLLEESSTFFAHLFDDGHYSMKLKSLKLDDVSFKGLSYMIRFLEQRRITVKQLGDFPEIWKVARTFRMYEMQKYCENRLENVPITLHTVNEVMSAASIMGLTDLHEKCRNVNIIHKYNPESMKFIKRSKKI